MEERNLCLQGMDTLKRIGNTIWGNAFELKKKKPGLKFNPQLVLVCNQPSNNSASYDIQTEFLTCALFPGAIMGG